MLKQCFLGLGLLAFSLPVFAVSARPNIIVILADDLGFSDIAPYGGEIQTPNLSKLAAEGLRFSNYHTAASCAPTRAMLMTGVDSHLAGVANIFEALPDSQKHSAGYQGHLNDKVVTVARLLNDDGYHTYMAGKWHLGYQDDKLKPINRGFEQTVMMPFSGADNWSDKSYLPLYEKALWFKNGEPLQLPEDFYSSKFLVDQVIQQIQSNQGDGKPFFSYLAFQAVHIPVQAPKEFTEKYLNTYQKGWDELRKKRQKAVRELGLVRADAPIKRMSTTQNWQDLSEDEQRFQAKAMAVYAGMVDAMDFHIGRLIRYLKQTGQYDNTLIVFTSDNGAEASAPYELSKVFHIWGRAAGYNRDYETLGEKDSYNYIGASFASAAVSPFGHYKFYSGEGGLRVPLIISGAGLAAQRKGKISNAMAYVKDLVPTILHSAGVNAPQGEYQGRSVWPITGHNLMPLISGQSERVYGDEDVLAYEVGGNAALIKGDYKIIYNRGMGDDSWQLFNIKQDPGETQPLQKQEPVIYADLLNEYQYYAKTNGVLPVPEGYEQRRQIMSNTLKSRIIRPLKKWLGLTR